jgi:intein/homing endonuclease
MRSVAPTTVSSEQGLKDLAEVLQRVGIDHTEIVRSLAVNIKHCGNAPITVQAWHHDLRTG